MSYIFKGKKSGRKIRFSKIGLRSGSARPAGPGSGWEMPARRDEPDRAEPGRDGFSRAGPGSPNATPEPNLMYGIMDIQ